jgi:hypothetical protein
LYNMRKSRGRAIAPAHFLAGSGCDGLRFDLQKRNRTQRRGVVPVFRQVLAFDG